jgi:hypothetical protein
MFDVSAITAAQVGSAVRWVVSTVGAIGTVQAATVGLDWAALAAAAATVASLLWSFWSNTKKVA